MSDSVAFRRRPTVVAAIVILALAAVTESCGLLDSPTLHQVSPVVIASPRVLTFPPLELPSAVPPPTLLSPSPSPSPPPVTPAPKPVWEAASTTFKTRANALKRLAKIRAHGFIGYRVRKVKARFEVERDFSTERQAAAAVRRLAQVGIRAHVKLRTKNN